MQGRCVYGYDSHLSSAFGGVAVQRRISREHRRSGASAHKFVWIELAYPVGLDKLIVYPLIVYYTMNVEQVPPSGL